MGTAALAAAVSGQATESSVVDPKQLARHVNELARAYAALQRQLSRVPVSVGNIVSVTAASGKPTTSIQFTSGTPQYIAHGLGRSYLGYVVIGQTDFGSLKELSLPTGKTSDKFIGLQSNVTATFKVYVF